MFYILHGPNYYQRQKKAAKLIKAARAKYPLLAVGRFFLDEEEDPERLINFSTSRSLFEKGKRAIVVSGLFSLEDGAIRERILLLSQSPDFLLIANETEKIDRQIEEISGSLKFEKQYFGELRREELAEFLTKESLLLEIKIEPPALNFLIDVLGLDTGGLVNEIKKLSLAANPITLSFIKSLGWYTESFGVFDLSRAINNPRFNLKNRLFFWETLLFQKIELGFVFNYLAKVASDRDFITQLAWADRKIKSGLLSIDQALLKVVLSPK